MTAALRTRTEVAHDLAVYRNAAGRIDPDHPDYAELHRVIDRLLDEWERLGQG